MWLERMTELADHTDPLTVVNGFRDAFNIRDVHGLGAIFTQNAEFVNIFGQRMRGRDGIESGHAHVFASALVATALAWTNLDTMRLGDDVAVIHAQWSRTRLSHATAASLPPGTGILTFVVEKTTEGWRIAAATNVQDAKPPVPVS